MTYTASFSEEIRFSKINKADSFFSRFRGLMLKKSLAEGEGLLLMDCPAIHCCFMRFPIDVVYLDVSIKVLFKETVKPWRLGKGVKGAKNVLELSAGAAKSVIYGMRLNLSGGDFDE